jgi:hypothetical protein
LLFFQIAHAFLTGYLFGIPTQVTHLQARLSASAEELATSRAQVQSLTDQMQQHQKAPCADAQVPVPPLASEREAALMQQLAEAAAKSNEHRSKLLTMLRKYKAMDTVRQSTVTELTSFCDQSVAPSSADLARIIAALDSVASSSMMPTPTTSAASSAADTMDGTSRVSQSIASVRTPVRPAQVCAAT